MKISNFSFFTKSIFPVPFRLQNPQTGYFNADDLVALEQTLQNIRVIDINEIVIGHADLFNINDLFHGLGRSIQHCEAIHLGKVFHKFNSNTTYLNVVLAYLKQDIYLSFAKMGIGINRDTFMRCVESIHCKILDLSHNHLHHLTTDHWELLTKKVETIDNLILDHNNLSSLSDEKMNAFVTILNHHEQISLDYNGFDTCNHEQWCAFCDAVEKNHICCSLTTIYNLSKERKDEIDAILAKNALISSRKSGYKN